ncbi:MAG: hypothetical protein GY913_22185 [Proteobacteria bacterium]|nr:hypothetical protein [Pseudomonadota bacterium]
MKNAALLALVASTLTACTAGGPGSELTEVLPDERIYVNMPVSAENAKDAEDGVWSDYYLFTAKVTRDVNVMIALPLVLVDHVTQYPPAEINEDETVATWGPYSDALDPVETALVVEHPSADADWTWTFIQKPKGADDAEYVPVIAGIVDAGSTRDIHSGTFAIDFDMLNTLNPNVGTTGVFVSEYDLDEAGVTAAAIFQGFSDGGQEIDAAYEYDQIHDGEGSMDLGWLADLDANGDDEIHVVRSRWTAEGAGRADAVLTGGSLGEVAFFESECWDGSFDPVYNTNSWTGEETGDAGLCAFSEASFDEE